MLIKCGHRMHRYCYKDMVFDGLNCPLCTKTGLSLEKLKQEVSMRDSFDTFHMAVED